MAKVQFTLDSKGINAMLRGAEMQNLLRQKGQEIAGRAGTGYGYSLRDTGQRAAVSVQTRSKQAEQDNAENNTLLKAMR